VNRPPEPKTVLITGGTGGIGTALAKLYAAPGVTLVLLGRDEQKLGVLAAACRNLGARVVPCSFDLSDSQHTISALQQVCEREQPDLAIVNAGITSSIGLEGAGESWERVWQLFELNVLGAAATVHAVLPSMRSRGRGQIALMSSLAAYYGLPLTPSYSASKAAVKAYGEALRSWLMPEGIRVNVIMPGYVDTGMTDSIPGPKPYLWPPEKAAAAIKKGLAEDRPRISFPFPLDLGCWLLSVLPPVVSGRLLKILGYGG
jgi:short-subunit dehydrogenase